MSLSLSDRLYLVLLSKFLNIRPRLDPALLPLLGEDEESSNQTWVSCNVHSFITSCGAHMRLYFNKLRDHLITFLHLVR